ncbi:cupin domain-containing protein [Pararhizobium sp. YC-54]|uniref:cupin domain-containing protein n=1 Tax=Pararhizobium sp. YC-54 TaxID=2986920 RepID=UPI0021F70604|nr:cupin domain-containing protein [Pararhizobium sp. YC-54]MCW0001498.1 cupin domain-containing protein [Pararhizobium sp. YC-54]
MANQDELAVTGKTPNEQVMVVQPGNAESYWQPVPANGYIDILFAPDKVAMEHPIGFGTQTVAPGGYVREHSHDKNEEVLFVFAGSGRAVVEGQSHVMQPGTAFFIGKNRRHTFINEGTEDLKFTWLLVPNGLEDFFRQIGRGRTEGQSAPEPFARPENVLEIERNTVFAAPPVDPINT